MCHSRLRQSFVPQQDKYPSPSLLTFLPSSLFLSPLSPAFVSYLLTFVALGQIHLLCAETLVSWADRNPS